MHIGQEADILLCGDDFHAVQGTLSQVKGLDKLHFVRLHFSIAHLILFDVNLLAWVNDLHDVTSLSIEMRLELRVCIDDSLNGLGKQLHVGVFWETDECRYIVQRGGGLLHAIHIDADLCVRERSRQSSHYGPRGGFYTS